MCQNMLVVTSCRNYVLKHISNVAKQLRVNEQNDEIVHVGAKRLKTNLTIVVEFRHRYINMNDTPVPIHSFHSYV